MRSIPHALLFTICLSVSGPALHAQELPARPDRTAIRTLHYRQIDESWRAAAPDQRFIRELIVDSGGFGGKERIETKQSGLYSPEHTITILIYDASSEFHRIQYTLDPKKKVAIRGAALPTGTYGDHIDLFLRHCPTFVDTQFQDLGEERIGEVLAKGFQADSQEWWLTVRDGFWIPVRHRLLPSADSDMYDDTRIFDVVINQPLEPSLFDVPRDYTIQEANGPLLNTNP